MTTQSTIAQVIVLLVLVLIQWWYLYRNFPQQKISSRTIDVSLVNKHVLEKKLPWWKAVLLYNQTYVFPVILTFYLVLLLIQQTKLFDLQLSWLFLLLNQNFVLYLVIASGIGTVFIDEQSDYQINSDSKFGAWWYLVLSCGLSLLWAYIILWQVSELWLVGTFIGWIAWLLIFLVGMMLIDEEEESQTKSGSESA